MSYWKLGWLHWHSTAERGLWVAQRQYNKIRWTVTLQLSENSCQRNWTHDKEVLCRSTAECQEFMLAELLPVKLPCSNKAPNRSIQKRRYGFLGMYVGLGGGEEKGSWVVPHLLHCHACASSHQDARS